MLISRNAQMKWRLLITAHLDEAGHRGVETTIQRCFPFYIRKGMQGKKEEVAQQYLLCAAHLLGLVRTIIRYVWLQARKGRRANGMLRD